MTHLIDKDAVVAKIEKHIDEIYAGRPFDSLNSGQQTALWYIKSIMSSINNLEAKEVVEEQEGICNGIFNRIIGDNWNLSIPLDKVGLKHGDKVKIFVTKENKLWHS